MSKCSRLSRPAWASLCHARRPRLSTVPFVAYTYARMNVYGGTAATATSSVDAYLASLPRGIASYPECQHKGEPLDVWLRKSPTRDLARLVPPQAAILLDRNRPIPNWVPDVHANVLYLAMRQAHFADDASFLAHAREVNRAVLETPANRLLFWAASPRGMMRAAGVRWGSLHRGSSLEVRNARENSVDAALSFPRALYPELILRANGTGFALVLENAGARNVEMQLRTVTPTHALFTGRWR
jgi:hypothetical protein